MLRQCLVETFPSLQPYGVHIEITFFSVGFVLVIFFMNWKKPKK